MARKLQYPAISKTLFVPVAAAVVYVGPFTQFDQPRKPANRAVQAQSVTFALGPPPVQQPVFTKFSEPARKRAQQNGWLNNVYPKAQTTPVFSRFSEPVKKRNELDSFTSAPEPVFVQNYVFSQFQQPSKIRQELQTGFTNTPQLAPFQPYVFSEFSRPLQVKYHVALFTPFNNAPYLTPLPDTHDGVFVKRKRKRAGKTPLDYEIERKERLRRDIEYAVFGPPIDPAFVKVEVDLGPDPKPPDLGELPQIMAALEQQKRMDAAAQMERDEEDDIELLLREIL